MNYKEYINRISFHSVKPDMKPLNNISDISNTILPEEDDKMKKTLKNICDIPKMCTFPIGAMINRGVSQMPENEAFVNIGIWNGFTFLTGMVNNPRKKCIGIDNWSQFGAPREDFLKNFHLYKSENHKEYDMDYIDYFNNVHQGPIGFYIYDGEHSYHNQLKALEIAEPFFARNCIILIDDTNPGHANNEPRKAIFDFMSQRSNQYQVLLDAVTSSPGHPTFWSGVIVLQKIN